MQRRQFLTSGAAVAAGLLPGIRVPAAETAGHDVHTVYVVAKCHLDIGFTDFEHSVLSTYFDTYIPAAIKTAQLLEQADGEPRFVWTLGSWMVYEYLEQAGPADRKIMETAILAGQMAWHAYPFTWNSEMVDRSLMQGAFCLSKTLDERFGIATIAGKLSDVPGHTRSIIGPAVKAGVQFIDIGANYRAVDIPPDERLFRWRDTDGSEVTVLYHASGYGGTAVLPGTGTAVAINVRTDNSGPYTADEIRKYYADLHKQFPNAKIVATNLNTVAKAVALVKNLPVVTQEICDTWVYGAGSDPAKVARYRELARLRLEWLASGKFKLGDSTDRALTSRLILLTEHNWGLDTGDFGDNKTLVHYGNIQTPAELAVARAHNPVFQKYELSWSEKRADIDAALSAMPVGLRAEAVDRLHAIRPGQPEMRGLVLQKATTEIESRHFLIAFDPKNGAIHRLLDRKTGREWASPSHPLSVFRYETFTGAESANYVRQYINDPKADWPFHVWGKPSLEGYPIESRTWEPELHSVAVHRSAEGVRIVSQMGMPQVDPLRASVVGWPTKINFEFVLPNAKPEIQITLGCFDKPANRLPEAMWLSFSPNAPAQEGWQLEKINRPVSPLNVISAGAHHLHAVTRRVVYQDSKGAFLLDTLDAPLVAPGQRSLMEFNDRVPDMREGVHVNLYNNLWNTAFPQWFSDDMRFRFILSFPARDFVLDSSG
jgi:hypothetical protein